MEEVIKFYKFLIATPKKIQKIRMRVLKFKPKKAKTPKFNLLYICIVMFNCKSAEIENIFKY